MVSGDCFAAKSAARNDGASVAANDMALEMGQCLYADYQFYQVLITARKQPKRHPN